jgi:hypothetical protein
MPTEFEKISLRDGSHRRAHDSYRKMERTAWRAVVAEMTLLRWLCNHSPVVNFVSDRIFATGFDGTLRLQPSLSHSTLDNLPMDPAFRAGKRSQILTSAARFDRRELHGRTASRALWIPALFDRHGVVLSSEPSVRPQANRLPST